MSHSRRQCMKVDPPNTTIPAGASIQLKLNESFRGEQWFSAAIAVESAAGSGSLTFGDVVNLGGNPSFCFPLPNHGWKTIPFGDIPSNKLISGDPNPVRVVSFFGEPSAGLLGITNTTDRAVTVQIVHCDRMFQED